MLFIAVLPVLQAPGRKALAPARDIRNDRVAAFDVTALWL